MTIDIEATVPVTPQVLRDARLRVSLNVASALELINKELESEGEREVTERDLEAWETGGGRPSLLEAEIAARVYLLAFVDLFQPKLPPENLTDFRRIAGHASPLSYEARSRIAQFERFYLAARKISTALGLTEEAAIPRAALSDINGQAEAEALAMQIRDQLQISLEAQRDWANDQAALEAWRVAVEDSGAFVFNLSLPVEDCRGASRWEPGGPPAILLNTADAVPAQLFSLLHEYAHLVFAVNRTGGALCDPSLPVTSQEEVVANRVAAAALVPRSLLVRILPSQNPSADYSSWPDEVRTALRRTLRVSHAVIGIRLQQLGLVRDAGVEPWRHGPSRARSRNRPVWQRYQRYLGQRTLSLARASIREERVSPAELSRILGIKVRDLESAVG